ncbi:contractile injection system protein, VgrG/Pvc8 family [Fusobacterium sp.]|uniref:contractile injection system protein, VgrG/Pvc8 family n=1 Tax=Fusobacterium sp. TaxID=68766 RepID=UPI0029018FFC|nr:contractile injection system protein, VgrG/Pvc8 family [Fusobacterium sp.]MDU1911576.1 contractile injection system protein, VgrG/Pvc8 family [Fusobacterium sp.]
MTIDNNYSIADLKLILNNNEISPEGYNINNLEINFNENKHTEIIIKIKVKNEFKNEWIIYSKETLINKLNNDTLFAFSLSERIYFSGIIQNISLFEEDSGDINIKLRALSKSEIMDREKYYRVYQNPNIRYIDIIKSILKKYPNIINIVGIDNSDKEKEEDNLNKKLFSKIRNGIIIQYFETDWEFLLRIMSHLGMGVFNGDNGGITLGFSKNIDIKKEWNKKNGNLGKGIDKENNVFYEATSVDFYNLGDILCKENKNIGYITRGKLVLRDGKFMGEYFLRQEEYIYEYISNENIKGCTIEGKVVYLPESKDKNAVAIINIDFSKGIEKTSKNKIQNKRIVKNINDWILLDKNEERFSFPYATPYSQSNTGYFCTPEIGDIVAVTFPTTEEFEGYVAWAINNIGSIRFTNPYVRNYTTKKEPGSEINSFEFKVNRENYYIESAELSKEVFKNKIIECKNDIKVYSKNNISIENQNKITILTDICEVEVGETYSESVKNSKKNEYGMLNERVDKAININSQSYNVTTGAYNVKK